VAELLVSGKQFGDQPLQSGVLDFQFGHPYVWFNICSLHAASNLLFLRLELPTTEASAHAPAKFFAFFGRHLLPSLSHAASPMHVSSAAEASAKEDLAQQQQAHRLPEVNSVPSEDGGHKPIPQAFHYESK
jgi:hypothetical protein